MLLSLRNLFIYYFYLLLVFEINIAEVLNETYLMIIFATNIGKYDTNSIFYIYGSLLFSRKCLKSAHYF